MTRREKKRLLQEENARKLAEEQTGKTRRRVTVALLAANGLLGAAGGVLLLYATGYGLLMSTENVVQMAVYPALAAAVLFPLLYGISFGVAHRVEATRPQEKKLARLATATSLAAALLTMVACVVFDLI